MSKLWRLKVRIRKSDKHSGKRIQTLLMELLTKSDISGATVWTGVNGFGKRGKAPIHLEGGTFNMPLIIETVDEQSKLEALLPEIKLIVENKGIVTIEEVCEL